LNKRLKQTAKRTNGDRLSFLLQMKVFYSTGLFIPLFLLPKEAQKKKLGKKKIANKRSFALCGGRGGLRTLHPANF